MPFNPAIQPATHKRGLTAGKLSALWTLGAALLLCGAYLGAEIYLLDGLGFPLDDSWIHLQFARQLAEGHGLSYQGGRWVGGSTAPLWTVLLSLGFLIPISQLAWAKLLGIGLFAAVAIATGKLAEELTLSPLTRRLAVGLVLLTPWLTWSALSGMEILLFSFLSLWGLILHLRELRDRARPPLSSAVLAVATLARPEGAFLLALTVIERAVSGERETRRQGLIDGFCLMAIVLLPTLLIYRALGGSWLPTTFAVKAGAPGDLLPSGRYLQAVINIFFQSQPLMLLFAGAGALRLVERLGTARDRGWALAAWPLGLPLAYAFLAAEGGPVVVGNFGRYYFPLLPVIIVLGLLGIEPALQQLRHRFATRWAIPLAVALLLAPSAWLAFQGIPRYLQTVANVEDSDVRAARWLAERLPPEAVLAVQDIGAVKYHLPNPVIDLAGIVNPEILPYLKGSGLLDRVYWENRLLTFLEPRRPDYLLVFERSYPMLTSQAQGFSTVQRFEIENNVTMAGNVLVLISTPWTRHTLRPTSDFR